MTPAHVGFALIAVSAAALLSGCAGGGGQYHYRYVPGKTATLRRNGQAEAPAGAPREVHAAIAAGNEIVGQPYVFGGGRSQWNIGYDCSGAASHVLRGAGKLRGVKTSHEFQSYGTAGEGEWITVHARKGHVFLVVAGLRFDTGWTSSGQTGPQWTRETRPLDGAVARHPAGL